jgi:hypothetical protein
VWRNTPHPEFVIVGYNYTSAVQYRFAHTDPPRKARNGSLSFWMSPGGSWPMSSDPTVAPTNGLPGFPQGTPKVIEVLFGPLNVEC